MGKKGPCVHTRGFSPLLRAIKLSIPCWLYPLCRAVPGALLFLVRWLAHSSPCCLLQPVVPPPCGCVVKIFSRMEG